MARKPVYEYTQAECDEAAEENMEMVDTLRVYLGKLPLLTAEHRRPASKVSKKPAIVKEPPVNQSWHGGWW